MSSAIMTIFIFIVTFGSLVIVHEFGHFFVARRCGIAVERFSIGFGPVLYQRQTKSGTFFALSLIPLGGYVKMRNTQTDDALSEAQQLSAFDKQSIGKRAAVLAAGPIANLLLAFILYWIINLLGVAVLPVKIGEVVPQSLVAEAQIPAGSEITAINGKQIESWQDAQLALVEQIGKAEFTLSFIPPHTDHAVNKTINIAQWRVDLDKENPLTALGIKPQPPQVKPVISQVVANSPAAEAGLLVGDEILTYNGQQLTDWQTFTDQVKLAQPLQLEVKRAGQLKYITLKPQSRYNSQTKQTEGFAGILPSSSVKIKKYGIIEGFSKAVSQTGYMIKITARSFYQLVTGALSLKNLSGPVSIAKSASQSASYGIVAYLYLLAFISINLGILNLLPLPILDGGHLLFLLIEKIKGSPLSQSTQALFYQLSALVLLMVMGLALFNDFSRL